jgi:3-oxoacyl-[acyl-carrier protein] reductase
MRNGRTIRNEEREMGRESLDGRHIVITGAASGIGLATARLFSVMGATVAMADRDAAVAAIAAEIPNATGVVMDVVSEASVAAAVAEAGEAMGAIDGVVNCAGADFAAPIEDTPPDQWNRLLAVNMTGPYNVVRTTLPWLRKAAVERATIVNIASGLGLRPIPARAAYAASKAGLIMFSKGLAMELAPKIRVNVVCPGVTDTPMLRLAWPGDEGIAKITEKYAIKALPTAEDLAYSILFMTSDASCHITGIALSSDGGSSYH